MRKKIDHARPILWLIFLCFPLPFLATLTGWFTAEVGRQPWVVYGLMRTADAVTPTLTSDMALSSLTLFGLVYTLIFSFGVFLIFRTLRAGPVVRPLLRLAEGADDQPMLSFGQLAKTKTVSGSES
jgi:cytochrome bd ubiquinol oxidase subunit I